MPVPEKFEAIGVEDFDKWLQPKRFQYTPQDMRPQDIDIKIVACGICGSDVHAASGNWGRPYAPVAVGHEIIGTVVAVGDSVDKSKYKIGTRVGVGAQCDCCGHCTCCHENTENYCDEPTYTYFSHYKKSGLSTQGGYANYIRVNNRLAFVIPDRMETKHVAPMLCGGITGFRPLMTGGVTKGTRVGVSGVGGIGHMVILFAKAMGAEVTAISRSRAKEEDARKLGADHFIATNEEGFEIKNRKTLDLIVSTGSSFTGASTEKVLTLLKPYKQMIYITSPPITEKLILTPQKLLFDGTSIGASALGSVPDIEYMLQFAANHDIKPWVETIDISEENVSRAWQRMEAGDVHYRFVLTGYDKCFK